MSNTHTVATEFVFAAPVETRIALVRKHFPEYTGKDAEALKWPRAKENPNTEGRKAYAAACAAVQEKVPVQITVPSVASLTVEQILELLVKTGSELARNTVVVARRKGEAFETNFVYGISDFLEESEEEGTGGKLSEEEVTVYLELCAKFYAHKEYAIRSPLSFALAQVALNGTFKNFLETMKNQQYMLQFMTAFGTYVAENDFESLNIAQRALKKQEKAFNKAKEYYARITAQAAGEDEITI